MWWSIKPYHGRRIESYHVFNEQGEYSYIGLDDNFILDPTHFIVLSSCQYISPHMLEKVDKSEYQHEDIGTKKGAGEVDSNDVGEVEKSDDE